MIRVLITQMCASQVELNSVEGVEGNPYMGQMKWGFRGLALLLVPITYTFSKGVFVYWITNNLFSLLQVRLILFAVFSKWRCSHHTMQHAYMYACMHDTSPTVLVQIQGSCCTVSL